MKKTLLVITLLFLAFNIFSQEQINNSDFENWTTTSDGGYDSLVNWNTSVFVKMVFNIRIVTAEKSSDAHQGSHAVKLESKTKFGNVVPGFLILGDIKVNASDQSFLISGGQAYTQRPKSFSVYVKYAPAGGQDTALAIAYLTKFNTSTNKADTIGGAIGMIGESISEYTKLTFPFLYMSEATPDTINITFCSTNIQNMKAGSILMVDDLEIGYEDLSLPTVALPATNNVGKTFTANWAPQTNVANYYFDLATDSEFTNMITGYDNLEVTENKKDITIPEAFYSAENFYYRVRVKYNNGNVSDNSNVIKVKNKIINATEQIPELSYVYYTDNKTLYLRQIEGGSIITIYSVTGERLYSETSTTDYISIEIDNPGAYILEIRNEDGVWRKKFVL